MIDALYRNHKLRVKLKEKIKRIDGSVLEGSAELPRRAAERLSKLDIAEIPRRDYGSLGMKYINDTSVLSLERRIEDFIYVELIRSGDEKTFRRLLLTRGIKVAQKAFSDAVQEIFRGQKPNAIMLNEEENVLYRMILDVVRFRIKDIIKAAEAFRDLGL